MAHAMTRKQATIIKDPNILGGEPVFRGTRVPFKILIDYLEGGDTLDPGTVSNRQPRTRRRRH
jgi:uncharacterized protein (DUF433 family)